MSTLLNLTKYILRWGAPLPRQPVSGYLEWSLTRRILRDYGIDLVLDVGANKGQFVRNLRRIGYRGHICSFEPIGEEYASLHASFAADPRWTGYNIALGDENTQRNFHIAVECTAMSSFLAPQSAEWVLREVNVEMRRLDAVFEDVILSAGLRDPRVLLKMDTQGFDLEVIHGAQGCIDRVLGIQSEVSVVPTYLGMPHYLEAILAYEQLGFELVGLAEAARDPERGGITEMNCVMMRPGGIV
jgi:FkbM family methyltransferase